MNAAALGFELVASEAKALAELGVTITNAANDKLIFHNPDNPDWRHFSFCSFAGPVTRKGSHLTTSAAVAIQPGKTDRSPTGTAASVRMALLHAHGDMLVGETLSARLIINSQFQGRIAEITTVGDTPAIVPEITGRARITGTHQHMLDSDDRLAGRLPSMRYVA